MACKHLVVLHACVFVFYYTVSTTVLVHCPGSACLLIERRLDVVAFRVEWLDGFMTQRERHVADAGDDLILRCASRGRLERGEGGG